MNGTEPHLHARIFRTGTDWYAAIDDERDPQPDNPYWYGLYQTHRAALEAACTHIATLHHHPTHRLQPA